MFLKNTVSTFAAVAASVLKKPAQRKNVDLGVLLEELRHIDEKVLPSQNYNSWEPDFLADYIVHTHHSYVKESLELIEAYASKVARVHGEGHPPVVRIYALFQEIARELTAHMQKEEQVLFPYIKKLVAARREDWQIESPAFGTVRNPVSMMEQEHEIVGDLLKEIAVLSHQYTPPDWACNTFKALYAKLDEFEQDLHLHVHLENNILFPKALLLERQ
jgi:regulator of cell morphogenesis and NO signaling